jgi:hypothetical protein
MRITPFKALFQAVKSRKENFPVRHKKTAGKYILPAASFKLVSVEIKRKSSRKRSNGLNNILLYKISLQR